MRRTMGMIIIILVLLTALPGCWNRRELDELAIAMALGIDKKEDKYQVTVQIVNPGEVSGKQTMGKGSPTTTYTETAKTLFEAFRKLTTKSPRKVYVSHVRMLVFGESLAKDGIGKVLDIISRDQEFRSDFYIVVAKGAPVEKILETYTIPQEVIPAQKMFKSLETAERAWAGIGKFTLDKLNADLLSEGKQPALTGLKLVGQKNAKDRDTQKNVENMMPLTSLQFRGIAVFKEDQLAGWLNEEESIGYNLIQGNVKSTVGSVACRGGEAAIEVIRTDAKVKGKVVQGKPEITIRVRTEENVADVECMIDPSKPDEISELEKKREQQLMDIMGKAISKAQEYKSDIFGFGDEIHRADSKAWQSLKEDWDDRFANLKVDMQVDVKIRRIGSTIKPVRSN